jgi:hypothetical protein
MRWLPLLLLAFPAQAAPPGMVCGAENEIAAALRAGHMEEEAGHGISGTGSLWQLFTTRKGETWTLLLTEPGGLSCLIGAGTGWEHFAPPKPQPETRTN